MKLRDLLDLAEGFEDRLEAARDRALKNGKKIKDTGESEKKSPVRKVSGKAYGGSKQKDTDASETKDL